jgi:hypothetical protein
MLEIKEDCDNCQIGDICKWTGEFERATNVVGGTSSEEVLSRTISPITVTVRCSRFQRKNQKQDGLFSR